MEIFEHKKVKLIDATLREGSQAPGVNFTQEQSSEIAMALDAIGIDAIECGHPIISSAEMERVKKLVQLDLNCPILTHARARIDDVRAAAESGAQWVGVFVGINEISREARLPNYSKARILELVQNSIEYAKKSQLSVRFTLEDTSRTDQNSMIKAFQTAIKAGADRICFSDTVGVLEPNQLGKRLDVLNEFFPTTDIEVHLHNDRGLALANALMAIDKGVSWISVSVNGVGERAGITDLGSLLANLYYRREKSALNGKELVKLSKLVENYSNMAVEAHHPIVGSNVFKHTADLHVKAMQRNKGAYNWIMPDEIGFSKHHDENE